MVSATHRPGVVDPLASLELSASSTGKSTNSFAQQLAAVLKKEVAASPIGSAIGTKVSPVPGQNSDARQVSVAVTPRAAAPAEGGSGVTPSTATETPASEIPTMLGMGPVPGTAPVAQVTDPAPVPPPEMTEGDAYWAAQPAAVQALRDMPDGQAKDQLALQLANEGYSIDTQIMVWGWDPQMTMQVRENQGYSWVPSYGSANIPVGPGLSVPGESTTYDPSSPPPGAIIVSTAFASGTIQNPLVQTNSTS